MGQTYCIKWHYKTTQSLTPTRYNVNITVQEKQKLTVAKHCVDISDVTPIPERFLLVL